MQVVVTVEAMEEAVAVAVAVMAGVGTVEEVAMVVSVVAAITLEEGEKVKFCSCLML